VSAPEGLAVRGEVSLSEVVTVVVPTVGRPSLVALLRSLAEQPAHPAEVIVVDDRRASPSGRDLPPLTLSDGPSMTVVSTGGRGPAAARNAGWRRARTPWVVVLDDDVVLPPDWSTLLQRDLSVAHDVAAVAGRIEVPLPADRRPSDVERATAALEGAVWATADMALRRSALRAVHGFDERFPRAYREDADLTLRLVRDGWRITYGHRAVRHPVRPIGRWDELWSSVRAQRGNADDALMRRLHGRGWRREAQCPRGRLPWHAATTAATALSLASSGRSDRSHRRRRLARLGAGAAGALTAEFALRRILPGPRTPAEVARMILTSVLIPPAAVWWRAVGTVRHRAAPPWPVPLRAVLLDRDGTLVHDVPYNGEPRFVEPVGGAISALDRLRAKGFRLAIVTNQSGVASGRVSSAQVDLVNTRVQELLGPFDVVCVCPHGHDEGCACRKPRPGLVLAAARALGVQPYECALIGDIGSDVEAAMAGGARGILVPTPQTRPEERASAERVAADLHEAVDLLLADPVEATR